MVIALKIDSDNNNRFYLFCCKYIFEINEIKEQKWIH